MSGIKSASFVEPRPFFGGSVTIEEMARDFRYLIGLDGKHGCDVGYVLDSAVKRMGGEIGPDPIPGTYRHNVSLSISADWTFKIFLPLYTAPPRDNFSIANELGHYFLHWDHTGPCEFDRYSNLNAQSNRFAMGLLAPKKEFSDAFREFDGDISLLAGHFGIAISAVKVRMDDLNLSRDDISAQDTSLITSEDNGHE